MVSGANMASMCSTNVLPAVRYILSWLIGLVNRYERYQYAAKLPSRSLYSVYACLEEMISFHRVPPIFRCEISKKLEKPWYLTCIPLCVVLFCVMVFWNINPTQCKVYSTSWVLTQNSDMVEYAFRNIRGHSRLPTDEWRKMLWRNP